MKLAMFRASQTPPQPKTMRQTKYLDPKASHEKKYFFCKNHFFAEIFTFFETSKSKNSRFDRSGDVHPLTVRIHQNPSKSEDLMLVEKIDLEDKKSPKIENFIFCFFNFHIS